MSSKYRLQFGIWYKEKDWQHFEDIETEDVPMKLGNHDLMEFVLSTPQGVKRIKIKATVEKYP
jgi:hypothetical protein